MAAVLWVLRAAALEARWKKEAEAISGVRRSIEELHREKGQLRVQLCLQQQTSTKLEKDLEGERREVRLLRRQRDANKERLLELVTLDEAGQPLQSPMPLTPHQLASQPTPLPTTPMPQMPGLQTPGTQSLPTTPQTRFPFPSTGALRQASPQPPLQEPIASPVPVMSHASSVTTRGLSPQNSQASPLPFPGLQIRLPGRHV